MNVYFYDSNDNVILAYGDKDVVDSSWQSDYTFSYDTLPASNSTTNITYVQIKDGAFMCKQSNSSTASYDYALFLDSQGNEIDVSGTSSTQADLMALPYGTKMRIIQMVGDSYSQQSVWFLTSCTRVGRDTVKVECTDILGILDNIQHNGGIYNTTITALIQDLMSGTGFTYYMNGVPAESVTGYLPIASVRENIHQLCMAMGVECRQINTYNSCYLDFTYNITAKQKALTSSNTYAGGEVEYPTPVTQVNVTAHNYTISNTQETIYTADSSVTNMRVEFEPHANLTADSTLTIVSSGANFAVVTGTGSLYGYPYKDETTIYSASQSGGKENVKNITDCTLISLLNAENVAKRLLSYFNNGKKISLDTSALLGNNGTPVTGINAYGESFDGYLESQDFIGGKKSLKTSAVIIEGHDIHAFKGNSIQNEVLISSNQSYSLPSGKTFATIVLIGGGGIGADGEDGEQQGAGTYYTDSSGNQYYTGSAGKGGAGGAGGNGGKIYVISVSVPTGYTLTFSIGAGTSTTYGGDTTVTIYNGSTPMDYYSSSYGNVIDAGYTTFINHNTYGSKGDNGYAGGDGGESGQDGGDAEYGGSGGMAGDGMSVSSARSTLAGGGGGGGAYAGTSHNGGDARVTYDSTGGALYTSGNSGQGADALVRSEIPSQLGKGGYGGNGGGGAGAIGNYFWHRNYTDVAHRAGYGFDGGSGSAGYHGADGCAIIYY